MRASVMRLLGLAAAVSSFAADQVTKSWAVRTVAAEGDLRTNQWLNIVSVHNNGVAFGIATGAGAWVLIAIGIAVTSLLVFWLVRSTSARQTLGLGLAIGGAVGNVVDRIYLGSVRDFLDFHWGDAHWPAFNLADAFILTGLAIVVLMNEQKGDKKLSDSGSKLPS